MVEMIKKGIYKLKAFIGRYELVGSWDFTTKGEPVVVIFKRYKNGKIKIVV